MARLYKGKYPISDKAEYVIDYVYDTPTEINYYHQLVRIKDDAILYANENIHNVFIHCWRQGIPYEKVSII